MLEQTKLLHQGRYVNWLLVVQLLVHDQSLLKPTLTKHIVQRKWIEPKHWTWTGFWEKFSYSSKEEIVNWFYFIIFFIFSFLYIYFSFFLGLYVGVCLIFVASLCDCSALTLGIPHLIQNYCVSKMVLNYRKSFANLYLRCVPWTKNRESSSAWEKY